MAHDHTLRPGRALRQIDALPSSDPGAGLPRDLRKERLKKEKDRSLLAEALYLITEGQVPLTAVSKRLKLSVRVLRALRGKGEPDPDLLRRKPPTGPKFQKFHDRAEAVLQDLLANSTHPLLLKEIRSELHRKAGLRVGLRLLSCFLRQRMNATYRLVRPITQIQNMTPAVLQR